MSKNMNLKCETKQERRTRIGLVSVSFRGHTPKEILEACRAAGLACVEWGSDVHAPAGDMERVREVAELQRAYNITCCSYGTYFRMGVHAPEEITVYIRAAKLLGTSVLRLWCGDRGHERYTEEQREALFADARRIAAIAEREGVTVCTEFHPNTYTDTAESTLELLHAADSTCFKSYWQPDQYRSHGENLSEARLLAPMTERIHVFHWIGKEKFPLSEGADRWRAYFESFDDSQTPLLEFMPDGSIETLGREAQALREILRGVK